MRLLPLEWGYHRDWGYSTVCTLMCLVIGSVVLAPLCKALIVAFALATSLRKVTSSLYTHVKQSIRGYAIQQEQSGSIQEKRAATPRGWRRESRTVACP